MCLSFGLLLVVTIINLAITCDVCHAQRKSITSFNSLFMHHGNFNLSEFMR